MEFGRPRPILRLSLNLKKIMIVCSCLGITDGDIRDATQGDRDMFAGTCCGSCLPLVSDIVRHAKDESAPREPDAGSPTDPVDRG